MSSSPVIASEIRKGSAATLALLSFLLVVPASSGRSYAGLDGRADGSRPALSAGADLPLRFTATGRTGAGEPRFLAHGPGYGVALTGEGIFLAVSELPPSEQRVASPVPGLSTDSGAAPGHRSYVARLWFPGATPTAIEGEEVSAGRAHFLVGAADGWRVDQPIYSRLRYRELYPGIDLVLYGRDGLLEYDFVVAPGADPSVVRLSLDGIDRLAIDERGALVAALGAGTPLRQLPPVSYQEVDGERREVASRYRLADDGEVAFDLGPYDRERPLIVDPVLVYSTYLGGTGLSPLTDTEGANTVGVDVEGNVYIAGYTISTDFPTTPGALDRDCGSGSPTCDNWRDGFVAKIDPTGTNLVYSTYLGGSAYDSVSDIAVHPLGEVYIVGTTTSQDFPLVNPFIPGPPGGVADVFVSKLAADGGSLVYSTYLGGNGEDTGGGIAVNPQGEAFVTGATSSTNFTTWPLDVHDATCGTDGACNFPFNDAFVTKFNVTGNVPIYSTYLGGSNLEGGNDIAIDTFGNAYVVGATLSSDFPRVNAFQNSLLGGIDAYVTRLNAAGTDLVYSTYLGGGQVVGLGLEGAFGVAVDSVGQAYVAGQTDTTDFPRLNAIQSSYGGGVIDAFVTKLSAGGSSLVYSTYLGGSDGDSALAIALDGDRRAYVAGQTFSRDFPVHRAFQTGRRGGTDAFVASLAPGGGALVYSSYLGGRGGDFARDIVVDDNANAYVAGDTASENFPVLGDGVADLLIGDYTNGEVGRYDSQTGAFVSTFVTAGSGGLERPNYMVVGPDGHLYVSDWGSVGGDWEVLRYDGQTGAFLGIFVTAGSGGLLAPVGLTFGPDGHLYVASTGVTGEVLRYDGSSGAFLDAFVAQGAGGLAIPTDIAFGPDGNLYVISRHALASQDEILQFDGETGAFLSVFVPPGGGGLQLPFRLAFGPDGHLYVSDALANAIRRYDGQTGVFIDLFVPAGSGGLNTPGDLRFAEDGTLHVLSLSYVPSFEGQLLRFDATTGAFIDLFATLPGVRPLVLAKAPGAALQPNLANSQDAFVTKISDGAQCIVSLELTSDEIAAGDVLEIDFGLHHRRPLTVDVPFHFWVEDAAGEVVVEHQTADYRFAPGDARHGSLALPIPADQPAGEYRLLVGVDKMQQSLAWAEARFRVVGLASEPQQQLADGPPEAR